ncbi:glutamine synthetase III [Bullifex porci]|uniref:glutamine synthetase III family protein n=1 Tax=Bullifex porci TaxID=2606638 RepID=UPI0023F41C47|nr:glutamine synthetase III [Bullifex porci]MDD7255160.1 glutamine synthetase III [Bullifex porci]MDY2740589.1 glutamine synthetase III [Bullifex porci]
METVADYFGSLVFNDETMRNRLPKDLYKALKKIVAEGKDLDLNVANSVANAMKAWAIEHGCTHYTHWFQPMTGITAEKHEAFISPIDGGKVLLEFSGKELIKGEPDASSFPSGGIRATFEARGYTAWDPTSYAFIKDDTLCIPTAFCSYSGEVLDKKTPLLRSMEAVSEQAVKVLHLFGKTDVKKVNTTVGPEQEYFLIDKKDYAARKDLIYTGRTLLGARSPKGQEMEDHYFGAIRSRVSAYMKDLDRELWKLGINAKTSHNEVAPCQHELAPVFGTTNIAVDHNQLTMELMKKIADRHGFACLLHEKPFAGVNGSGKHNNWSISTDTGINLLEPGDNPKDNAQFLLFLVAVIKAIDEYQDLMRVSVASAGNDHRLGANEAPPAIVSMFLGDELTEILEALVSGKAVNGKGKVQMELGVHVLPAFPKDTTDRNRTSPFAFTGNKFEFRMLGSSFSVAGPNIVLNTIVAKALKEFYEELKDATDFNAAVTELVKKTYSEHKRIVFNGNNYAPEWVVEAEKRGLLNLKSSPDAYDTFIAPKNIELFSEFGIFNSVEMHSRYEILNEEYSKTIHIEATTLIDMVNRQVLPACTGYAGKVAAAVNAKKLALPTLECKSESALISELTALIDNLESAVTELEKAVALSAEYSGSDLAHYTRNSIIPLMDDVRGYADSLELIVDQKDWPYPTYGEMLFYV